MMQLSRSYHFYAAHRNPDAGEKCGRIHGHTYKVIVTLDVTMGPDGISILFENVDRVLLPIIKKYDHYFMIWREDPLYSILMEASEAIAGTDFPTSAENVAQHLMELVIATGLPVYSLELKETESSNIIINNY